MLLASVAVAAGTIAGRALGSMVRNGSCRPDRTGARHAHLLRRGVRGRRALLQRAPPRSRLSAGRPGIGNPGSYGYPESPCASPGGCGSGWRSSVTGWLVASAAPAWPITEEDVERACAEQDAALDALVAARARLDEATREWEELTVELDAVSTREQSLSAILEDQQGELAQLEEQVAEQAVEMYMNGGAGMNQMVFTAGSVDELVTGQEFLETDHRGGHLLTRRPHRASGRAGEAAQRALADPGGVDYQDGGGGQQRGRCSRSAAADHLASYEQLAGECKELYAAYQAEKARPRGGGGRPPFGRFGWNRRGGYAWVHLPHGTWRRFRSSTAGGHPDPGAAATRAPT